MLQPAQCLELAIIVVVFLAVPAVTENTLFCEKDLARPINLHCQDPEVLVIEQAFYGRDNSVKCEHSVAVRNQSHCDIDSVFLTVQTLCFGKVACRINPKSLNSEKRCSRTRNMYLEITYSCVSDEDVVSACSQAKLDTNFGFIISPNYPNEYPPKTLCVTEILLREDDARIGAKLRVQVLDLELEARTVSKGCYDWLIIADINNAASTHDYCGTLKTAQEPLTVWFNGQTRVKFRPDAQNQFRGFLLKFEVINPDEKANDNKLERVTGYHQLRHDKLLKSSKAIERSVKKKLIVDSKFQRGAEETEGVTIIANYKDQLVTNAQTYQPTVYHEVLAALIITTILMLLRHRLWSLMMTITNLLLNFVRNKRESLSHKSHKKYIT